MNITEAPPPATRRPPDPGPLEWPALAEIACAETRLSDFGDESEFRPALERLLAAWREEAGLNEQGRRIAWARTVGSLKNRLWTESCRRAHPEIEAAPLAAPLVIVGPHGSGATALHRLLACDARWSHLRAWEGLNPAPRLLPAWPPLGPDVAARQREAQAVQAQRRLRYPLADRLHPMAVDSAEEEALLMNHTFSNLSVLGLYDMPGWWRWFAQADHASAYRALARQLQLVAWTRGDAPGQRWLLKASQHMLNLPALLAVFPQAKIVFTHRDPLKTVACTLATMTHFSAAQTDRDCRASVRDTWLEICETAERRRMAAREALDPAQLLDLHQQDIAADWRTAVAAVQAFANMAPDPEAEEAMQVLRADGLAATVPDPPHALQDLGLDEAAIDARFAFVRERHGLARE